MDLFINILGWTGTTLFLVGYYLVSHKKLDGAGTTFQWMNLGGSVCLGVNVWYKQVWSAVVLEVVWSTIAILALIRIFRSRNITKL